LTWTWDVGIMFTVLAVTKSEILYFNNNGCPISPRWSIVGCMSTTICRISFDSHASSRKFTAISQTSGAGSYSWVRSSRRVQAFALVDPRIKSPRWRVAYNRMCWEPVWSWFNRGRTTSEMNLVARSKRLRQYYSRMAIPDAQSYLYSKRREKRLHVVIEVFDDSLDQILPAPKLA
jgi:hypothetical protein